MFIKNIFNIIRQKFGIIFPSTKIKTNSACTCSKNIDSPDVRTRIVTLKSPTNTEYEAKYHGLDYDKIIGYTVIMNINDYLWVLPHSDRADAYYDAYLSNEKIAVKVDLDRTITHGRLVRFVIQYLP